MKHVTLNIRGWITGLFVIVLLTSSINNAAGMLDGAAIFSLGTLGKWSDIKTNPKEKLIFCARIALVLIVLGNNVYFRRTDSMIGTLIAYL